MGRVLALIPGVFNPDALRAAECGRRARNEYAYLAEAIGRAGRAVEVVDYASLMSDRSNRLIHLICGIFGPAIGLAVYGALRSREDDVLLSAGETLGVPLALLLKLRRHRPAHLSIALDPSKRKTRLLLRWLGIAREVDIIVVYSQALRDLLINRLGVAPDRVALVWNYVDDGFYRPLAPSPPGPLNLCAAGFSKRDYGSLVAAMAQLPEARMTIEPTGHPLRLARRCVPAGPIPNNVTFVEIEPGGLRDLYARADAICVPLFDGQATNGVTTILEAMAMGKPVIATRTQGLGDLILDGETGLTVAPGDVGGWVAAIRRLQADPDLRQRLGEQARRWVETHATLERWGEEIVQLLSKAATARSATHEHIHDDVAPVSRGPTL